MHAVIIQALLMLLHVACGEQYGNYCEDMSHCLSLSQSLMVAIGTLFPAQLVLTIM